MATGLNASLKFGPAPAKTSSSASKPAPGASPPSGGGGSSRSRRGEAEAWQAECLRVADQLGAAVPEEEDAAPSSEWRAQIERVLAVAAAAEARAAPRAALSPAELDAALEQLAASDPAAAAPLAALRAEHKAAEAAVGVLQQELGSRCEYTAALEQELAFLNKELEERQREAAQAGDTLSDTRPVARLTQACAQLRQELLAMDVRTGVLQTAVLRAARAGAGTL
ncbi:hypothetical protein ABPG75_002177 [Micractinium tetrahymenae]